MLYMLGQHIIDLKDNKEKFLIKVGVSRDVDKRIRNYRSDNPSAVCISQTAGTEPDERRCHSFLFLHGNHYNGEWFSVSKQFFNKCLQEGFTNFPLKKKGQNVYIYTKNITLENKKTKKPIPSYLKVIQGGKVS